MIASDDKELEPAPPSPPRALAVPLSFWWTVAVGRALAAVAAVLAWSAVAGVDPLAAPELSPLAELERALGLLAAEAPAGAFAHLSQALRRYLGRRLGFHALESTTTEIQRRLAALRLDTALVQRAVAAAARLRPDQVRAPSGGRAPRPRRASPRRARWPAAVESHLAPIDEAAASRHGPRPPPQPAGAAA